MIVGLVVLAAATLFITFVVVPMKLLILDWRHPGAPSLRCRVGMHDWRDEHLPADPPPPGRPAKPSISFWERCERCGWVREEIGATRTCVIHEDWPTERARELWHELRHHAHHPPTHCRDCGDDMRGKVSVLWGDGWRCDDCNGAAMASDVAYVDAWAKEVEA